MKMRPEFMCPECGNPCECDEVDVGVGVIYGPWRCAWCLWFEPPAPELSALKGFDFQEDNADE